MYIEQQRYHLSSSDIVQLLMHKESFFLKKRGDTTSSTIVQYLLLLVLMTAVVPHHHQSATCIAVPHYLHYPGLFSYQNKVSSPLLFSPPPFFFWSSFFYETRMYWLGNSNYYCLVKPLFYMGYCEGGTQQLRQRGTSSKDFFLFLPSSNI